MTMTIPMQGDISALLASATMGNQGKPAFDVGHYMAEIVLTGQPETQKNRFPRDVFAEFRVLESDNPACPVGDERGFYCNLTGSGWTPQYGMGRLLALTAATLGFANPMTLAGQAACAEAFAPQGLDAWKRFVESILTTSPGPLAGRKVKVTVSLAKKGGTGKDGKPFVDVDFAPVTP